MKKPRDRVQRVLKGGGRTVADRVIHTGITPDTAAEVLHQLRRRGEAQLGQSSPTTVWRRPTAR